MSMSTPSLHGTNRRVARGLLIDRDGKIDVHAEKFRTLFTASNKGWNRKPKQIEMDILPILGKESEGVSRAMDSLRKKESYIYRIGEIVLWCRRPRGEYKFDKAIRMFVFREFKESEHRSNKWMAGVITEVPKISNTVVEAADFIQTSMTPDEYRVFLARDRDPTYHKLDVVQNPWVKGKSPFVLGDQDPTIFKESMQVKVPFTQLRPVSRYGDTLCNDYDRLLSRVGQPWHPSFNNAMKLMATISITGRFRFKGTWPNAIFYARGIYLGAELLLQGDAVFIQGALMLTNASIRTVLVITDICVEYRGIPAPDIPKRIASGNPVYGQAKDINVFIYGYHYSPVPGFGKLVGPGECEFPAVMSGIDQRWYHTNSKDMKIKVRLADVIGRVYHPDLMASWTKDSKHPAPGCSLDTVASRKCATEKDPRIERHFRQTFFWAETRMEGLGCQSYGDLPVRWAEGEWYPRRELKRFKPTVGINGKGERVDDRSVMMRCKRAEVARKRSSSQTNLVDFAVGTKDEIHESKQGAGLILTKDDGMIVAMDRKLGRAVNWSADVGVKIAFARDGPTVQKQDYL